MFPSLLSVLGLLAVGAVLGAATCFGIMCASAGLSSLEDGFNSRDAALLQFLDDTLCDLVYDPGQRKWGVMTLQRRFLASGDTAHEAIAKAQTVLEANAVLGTV